MTKRVVGVFAALVLSGSALACSSSSSPGPAAATDTGVKTDAPVDSGKTDTGKPDTTPPAKVYPSPQTVGNACTSHADCDPDGEEIGYCSNGLYAVGPLNPTGVCLLYGPEVCDPSTDTELKFCDIKDMSAKGLCGQPGTDGSVDCSPVCVLKADGSWESKCTGKNACSAAGITTEGPRLVGTCQGGCQADADCPSGSKCDPGLQYCVHACTTDANCKSKWSTGPANWKCNVARGACELYYDKTTGDTCATKDDCLICYKTTAAPSGTCSNFCTTGGTAACKAGFSCDSLLDATNSMGAPMFTFTTVPAGISGLCLRNCAADTECLATEQCVASAGMTQKTCKPKTM
jgi:hypothetical protein